MIAAVTQTPETLAASLRPTQPGLELLSALTEDEASGLAALIDQTRQRRAAALEAAIEDGLAFLRPSLRKPVRSALFPRGQCPKGQGLKGQSPRGQK